MVGSKSKCQRYEVEGDKLVKSQISPLYVDPGTEALYKVVDIYLRGFEWVLLWSYENDSDNEYSQRNTITTALRTRSGKEIADNFKLSAGFSNFGISMSGEYGQEHKTFTEEETTSSTEREQTYTVKANSSVYVYQKVYYFKVGVWFKLDTGGKLCTVGNWHRLEPREVSSEIAIQANEFTQSSHSLQGADKLTPKVVERAAEKDVILEWQWVTERAKSYLTQRGV